MEWILVIVGAYLIWVMFKAVKGSSIISLTPTQLDVILKDKSVKRQFVDVRTSGEFSNSKIKGFKNIPV